MPTCGSGFDIHEAKPASDVRLEHIAAGSGSWTGPDCSGVVIFDVKSNVLKCAWGEGLSSQLIIEVGLGVRGAGHLWFCVRPQTSRENDSTHLGTMLNFRIQIAYSSRFILLFGAHWGTC